MSRIVIAVASIAILLAGCSAQRQVSTSPPQSRIPWGPALSAVSNVQLNLNSTPVSPPLQGPGPLQINPTITRGRVVVSKLLGWLRQAKPLPQTPIPLPEFGDHMLSFALHNGKSVTVSQYFVSDGSGSYQASPTIVLISTPLAASNSGRYRDPALAQWLNAGWSVDLEKLAPHWTCANKRPPNPYLNEIRGAANGIPWVVAADGAQGCVVLYIGKGTGWQETQIAAHAFSSPWTGAYVEQVQFLDPMHGFVLISGTLYDGQIPRTLYATEDGGVTWHSLPVDSEQPFPYSNTVVNMRFTSPSVGWLVALNNSGRVYVYHTASGGETWTDTSFSLPANATSDPSLIALPPTFQNAQVGTIEVVSQWGGLLWFNTTDGGKHWTFDPLGNG